MSSVSSGLDDVLESHAVVAAFWMRACTEARALADDLASQRSSQLAEMEQKAFISLEALNDESAQHRMTQQKLQDTERDLAKVRGELVQARAEKDVFAQEINQRSEATSVEPPDESTSPLAELHDKHEVLIRNFRKIGLYVRRIDANFDDHPDAALRALTSALRLLKNTDLSLPEEKHD